VIVDVDELLSFYVDNRKTQAADVASDVAPRKHVPTATQTELLNLDYSNGVAESSAIMKTNVDGMTDRYILYAFSLVCKLTS